MSLVLFFGFFVSLSVLAYTMKVYEALDVRVLKIVASKTRKVSNFVNSNLTYSALKSESYSFFEVNRNKRFVLHQGENLSSTNAMSFTLDFINPDYDYAVINAGIFCLKNEIALTELLSLVKEGKVEVL